MLIDSLLVLVRDLSRMMSATELQDLKIRTLKKTQSFQTMVFLNEESKAELEWWIEMLNRWNGRAAQFSNSPHRDR
jgi:hypothetical protein